MLFFINTHAVRKRTDELETSLQFCCFDAYIRGFNCTLASSCRTLRPNDAGADVGHSYNTQAEVCFSVNKDIFVGGQPLGSCFKKNLI